MYGECFDFEQTFAQKLSKISSAAASGFSINEEILILIFEIEFRHQFDVLRELVSLNSDEPDQLLTEFYISLLFKNYNLELFGLVCQKLKKLPRSHISIQLFDALLCLFEAETTSDYVQSFAGETLASLSGKLSADATHRILRPAIDRLDKWNSPYLLWSCLRIISCNISFIQEISTLFSSVYSILNTEYHGHRHSQLILIEALSIFMVLIQRKDLSHSIPFQYDPLLLLRILVQEEFQPVLFHRLCESSDIWYSLCIKKNQNVDINVQEEKALLRSIFRKLKETNWDFKTQQGYAYQKTKQTMALSFMLLNYFYEFQTLLNVQDTPDSQILVEFQNISPLMQADVGFHKFLAALSWSVTKNKGTADVAT